MEQPPKRAAWRMSCSSAPAHTDTIAATNQCTACRAGGRWRGEWDPGELAQLWPTGAEKLRWCGRLHLRSELLQWLCAGKTPALTLLCLRICAFASSAYSPRRLWETLSYASRSVTPGELCLNSISWQMCRIENIYNQVKG